jgi:hypothetical protein
MKVPRFFFHSCKKSPCVELPKLMPTRACRCALFANETFQFSVLPKELFMAGGRLARRRYCSKILSTRTVARESTRTFRYCIRYEFCNIWYVRNGLLATERRLGMEEYLLKQGYIILVESLARLYLVMVYRIVYCLLLYSS